MSKPPIRVIKDRSQSALRAAMEDRDYEVVLLVSIERKALLPESKGIPLVHDLLLNGIGRVCLESIEGLFEGGRTDV